MKKIILLAALTLLLQAVYAGGLLTNYNQSAQYVRMLSRNASFDIDAVFYNPAGLVKMEDGWYFAFYSQTIYQTREIDSNFPLLNSGHYEGETNIPVFPNGYAAYKKNKWAFSLGFGPVAGGGTANFENGIPSLEIPFSKIPSSLSGLSQIDESFAVNGYDLEMSFEVHSAFWGIQAGATYAINDKYSVYGGARILPSENTYKGSIKNIQIKNASGEYESAYSWLTNVSGEVSTLSAQAYAGAESMYSIANAMQAYIDASYGSATLSQLEAAGAMDAATKAQIEAGLSAVGVTQAQIDAMNVSQIKTTSNGAGDELSSTSTTLASTAETLSGTADNVKDKEVNTTQKGLGITPIIGFNYSPNDDWNFALKYEFKTKLTLENDTEVDDLGLFPDGEEKSSDIPAILAVGVGYRGLKWLEAQLSYNMYFDKDVDHGYNIRYKTTGSLVHRDIDRNHYELALGLQFNLSEKFGISTGLLHSVKGVLPQYQSDFSYANTSTTVAGGIVWKLTDRITVDAGMLYTIYQDDTVTFTDPDVGEYDETYGKKTISFAAGICYNIF